MKNVLLSLILCVTASAATKPTSPALQTSNALATGLVRDYFVGSSTTTITDLGPSGLNLTCAGSPTLTTAPGGVGSELLTTGAQNCTGSDTGMPSGDSARSIAGFFSATNTLANGANSNYFLYGTGTSNEIFYVAHYTTPNYCTTADDFAFGELTSLLCGNTSINDGAWHRFVLTFDGTTAILYVDGARQASGTYSSTNTVLTGSVSLANSSWVGGIGDTMVWNRALSSADVASDYADPWQTVRPPVPSISSISPAFAYVSTAGNAITLTGISTAWTGSTNFTASAGTITAKTNNSSTSETLTFTAPSTPQTVTITDSSTGLTVSLPVYNPLKNVSVQTTTTQAMLSYTAPNSSACTVQSAMDPAFAVLDNDVDPVQFSGSNLDTRNDGAVVTSGLDRKFVVGKRGQIGVKINNANIYVSLALPAASLHYYQITCGSYVASGTFETMTIPAGSLYQEPFLADPSNPGYYLFPTILPNQRNRWITHPITGFQMHQAVLWGEQPNGQVNNYTGLTWISTGGTPWSNPTNASSTAALGTTAATVISSTTPIKATMPFSPYGGAVWCPSYICFTLSNAAYQTFASFNWVTLSINAAINIGGTAPTGANATISYCLAMHSTTACDNSSAIQTVALTTTPTVSTLHGPAVSAGTVGDLWRATYGVGIPGWVDQETNGLTFLIWKTTNSADTVSINSVSVTTQYAVTTNPGPGGGYQVCSYSMVTGPDNGEQGYLCGLNGIASPEIFIGDTTGTTHYHYTAAWYDQIGSTPNSLYYFNDPSMYYQLGGGSGSTHPNLGGIYKIQVSNNPTYADVTPQFSDDGYNLFDNCSGVPICSVSTRINTASGTDLASLITNFTSAPAPPPVYDVNVFSPGNWANIRNDEQGRMIIQATTNAVLPGAAYWVIVFDPNAASNVSGGTQAGSAGNHGCIGGGNPGCVVAANPVWARPGCSFCLYKEVVSAAPGIVNMATYFPGSAAAGSGPYHVTVDATGGGDGSLTAVSASPATHCSAPYASYYCEQYTITGQPAAPSNYFYNSSAGDNGAVSIQVGDQLGLVQASFQYNFETAEVESVLPSATSGEFKIIIRRLINQEAGASFASQSGTPIFYMQCSSNKNMATDASSGPGISWWDFANHPYATGTGAILPFYSNVNAHAGFVAGAGAVSVCPDYETRCGAVGNDIYGVMFPKDPSTPLATTLVNPAKGIAQNISGFNGIVPTGKAYQSHFGLAYNAPSSFQGFPFLGQFGAPTAALVSGTANLYKFPAAGGFYGLDMPYQKIAPIAATSGFHPLINVSGLGSVIGDGSTYNYRYCITAVVGECYSPGGSPSAVGDVFVNLPYTPAYLTSYANGANISQNPEVGQEDITITNADFGFNAMTNTHMTTACEFACGAQSLTDGGAVRRVNSFLAPVVTPDGAWMIFPLTQPGDGSISPFMVGKVPPYRPDNVNRTTWIPQQISVPAHSGATGAYIRFGYAENGNPTAGAFYATARKENTVATAGTTTTFRSASVNPFFFETSEGAAHGTAAWSPTSCASGCTITINALPQRTVYWQTVYTASGSIVSTGPPRSFMTP